MIPSNGELPGRSGQGSNELPPAISRRVYRQQMAAERAHSQNEPVEEGTNEEIPASKQPKKQWRWPFHFLPAFWTITGIFSLIVNVVLIVVILLLASQLFSLKAILEDQLLSGLAGNFQLMDQARITTNVAVSTKVPAKFTLPLETDTTVVLNKDVVIKSAKVTVHTGGLQITNADANIVLPAGVQLPIHLSLTVPVDQQIPVDLNVPVNIPLNQTDLHKPFVGLQNVVQPYQSLLGQVPDNWKDILCGARPGDFCRSIIP